MPTGFRDVNTSSHAYQSPLGERNETGCRKDYAKPVRTDFPLYNDLPEENAVDYTWCKRYALQNDGRP
ncbi:TPA: hypothetical protein I3816_000687 [Enterobacter cloacae]|nr:hypothetical protein [Enterobacter cloacae]HAS1145039.1 hypothetical protein [Enterobacter cloacae]HAS1180660.1 hypothetical protein [Enterobacter cloacae]HAS1196022.1 hypothetical protein [Enterobacter cloacae]HDW0669358.1 hypothetical protein [Enterobacter cloacae]